MKRGAILSFGIGLALAATSTAGTFTADANCSGDAQHATNAAPATANCTGVYAFANASASLGHVFASAITQPPFGSPDEPASAGAGWSGTYYLTITGGSGTSRWAPILNITAFHDILDSASIDATFGPFRVSRDNTATSLNDYGCPWLASPDFCADPFTFGESCPISIAFFAFVSSLRERGDYGHASVDLGGLYVASNSIQGQSQVYTPSS